MNEMTLPVSITAKRARLCAIILVSAFCSLSLHADNAHLALEARSAQYNQNYLVAIRLYTRILRSSPYAVSALSGRGQSYFASDKMGPAIADFTRWRATDSANPYASIWLYLAKARSGSRDGRGLPLVKSSSNSDRWPRPVIEYLAGRTAWDAMFDTALKAVGTLRERELCEAEFFFAENSLASGKESLAMGGFNVARGSRCKQERLLQSLSASEYAWLYRVGYRPHPVQ